LRRSTSYLQDSHPHSRQLPSQRRFLPLWVGTALLAAALSVVGCGGGGSRQEPELVQGWLPHLSAGSLLRAVPLALSPDETAGTAEKTGATPVGQHRIAIPHDASATSAMAHWFFLVNGEGLPSDIATSDTPLSSPPYVLTVNGTPPDGAPVPNGGTGVGVAKKSPSSSISQLWKAVSGTTSGHYYLRSAQSFQLPPPSTVPSLLTGYGAQVAALDLGYVSSFNTSIYWNQKLSPTGDNSAFQQWAYSACDGSMTGDCGQLSNLNANAQLYYDPNQSTAGVGTSTSGPTNQWFAYPNYYPSLVVNQADSDPPYPPFTGGEQAAYEYLSTRFLPGTYTTSNPAPSCTYEGTSYTGIRCEYVILSATSTLQTCASTSLSWSQAASSTNPGSFNGMVITDDEWKSTLNQLQLECQYASDIQTTFNYYNQILNDVFINATTLVPTLADDLALSQSQNLNVRAIDGIEGALYTILSAAGSPALGVLANLMEMSVDSAVAGSQDQASAWATQFKTTIATLYSDLGKQFSVLTDQTRNGENKILEDWGRLQKIGPLTQLGGYNGLGLDATAVAELEQQATKGYSLAIMQMLLPASGYNVQLRPSQLSSSDSSFPSWAQYAYPTYGSNTSNYNWGVIWSIEGSFVHYPSQKVMQNDIVDNGGNLFELFNVMNGWRGMPRSQAQTFTCNGTILTLFNATPVDFKVKVTRRQGRMGAPGYCFDAEDDGNNCGLEGIAEFELRPYGYLPTFYAAHGGIAYNDLTMDVEVLDPSRNTALSFTFGNDGCRADSQNVWNITRGPNYDFSPANYPGSTAGNNAPSGIWLTITNSALKP
jgi:hypothetical protein